MKSILQWVGMVLAALVAIVLTSPPLTAQLNRVSPRQIVCAAGSLLNGSAAGMTCSATLTLGTGTNTLTARQPIFLSFSQDDIVRAVLENRSATANADTEIKLINGAGTAFLGVSNLNNTSNGANSVPTGAHRSWLDVSDTTSGAGWDMGGGGATANVRFYTGGYTAANFRATVDVNGVTLNNGTSFITTANAGLAVANVGANSCGTSAATIAGGNNAWNIVVGATSGTQCRVAFTVTAATRWSCVVTDETTGNLMRYTAVDTTHGDVLGTMVAGDTLTGICFPR